MAITSIDDITLSAFVISLISILLVIISFTLQRRSRVEHHNGDTSLEVSAIVSEFNQRMKRLEENLVDQKVKLEILDLRVNRSRRELPNVLSSSLVVKESESTDGVSRGSVQPSSAIRRVAIERETEEKRLGSTELDVLRIVYDSRGRATAKDIQQKIGRTREHTARMMNALFRDGLVERDSSVRPFSYSVSQRGSDLWSR